jgi:alpha-L-fucosidase 2
LVGPHATATGVENIIGWRGGPRDRLNPDARSHLTEVRRLLPSGQLRAAEMLARGALLGTPRRQNPYQSLVDLELLFSHPPGDTSEYHRELDLDQAVVTVQYRRGGTQFWR